MTIHLPTLMSERFANMPRSEARRAIAQGEVLIHGEPVTDLDVHPTTLAGHWLHCRHGRIFVAPHTLPEEAE